MAIKGYSAFPKALALLEPYHLIFQGHIQDNQWCVCGGGLIGISLKGNVIAWLEFEIANYNVVVHHVNHYTTRTLFLMTRHHPNRWEAVVSLLNYLIFAVDLWGSLAQPQVKHAVDSLSDSFTLLHIPPCCIQWLPMLHALTTRITFALPPVSDNQWQAETRWLNDDGGLIFYCCQNSPCRSWVKRE